MPEKKIKSPLKTLDGATLLEAGRITKAHGIRGEVVLHPSIEATELLSGKVFIRRGEGAVKELEVARARVHHGNLLVSFSGLATRNEAEELRGHTLFIPLDRLPEPDEDELYMFELPGLAVFVRDESGKNKPLGVVTSVDMPAGQEIWTIMTPDEKEILFPAAEEFILSIDLDKRSTVIAPPPGLLELYLD